MERQIDLDRIRSRQETYLLDHYLSIHNTVVSVALAIAGLGAASLVASSKEYGGYIILLWILWFASFLAIAVAYAGTMIGSIVLPARVPAVTDLLLPLLIAVFEFLLFGVLSHQVTGVSDPATITMVWFFSFTGFCLFAGASIWRAGRIIKLGTYESDIHTKIGDYLKGLTQDVAASSALGGWSLIAGIVNAIFDPPIWLEYVFSGAVALGLIAALGTHARAARILRTALS